MLFASSAGPVRTQVASIASSWIRTCASVISPPGRAQQIPELVHPTALMGRTGIDRLQRRGQSGTAIRHNQLELAALQAPSIEIV